MRRSRFTEERIIAILAEQERGMSTAEVCRRHGVSSATFYKWKAKFGGMDVSNARADEEAIVRAHHRRREDCHSSRSRLRPVILVME